MNVLRFGIFEMISEFTFCGSNPECHSHIHFEFGRQPSLNYSFNYHSFPLLDRELEMLSLIRYSILPNPFQWNFSSLRSCAHAPKSIFHWIPISEKKIKKFKKYPRNLSYILMTWKHRRISEKQCEILLTRNWADKALKTLKKKYKTQRHSICIDESSERKISTAFWMTRLNGPLMKGLHGEYMLTWDRIQFSNGRCHRKLKFS